MCSLWFFSLVQNNAQTDCYSVQPAVGKFAKSSSSTIWSYICWSQLQNFYSILQQSNRSSESKHNLNQIKVEQASRQPKFQSSLCFAANDGKGFCIPYRIKLLFIQYPWNLIRAMIYLHIEPHRSFSMPSVLHHGWYQLPSIPTDNKRNLAPKKYCSAPYWIVLLMYSKLYRCHVCFPMTFSVFPDFSDDFQEWGLST